LLRQHLTAVKAAAAIGSARVTGDELGSQALTFSPEGVAAGLRTHRPASSGGSSAEVANHRFTIGTAGSATLVLQTILPALLAAREPSHIVLEGGTHNPFAPPFDFLARTFVPLLQQMGASLCVGLERYGFYPAGGGIVTVDVQPAGPVAELTLLERGDTTITARALLASLPDAIGKRELSIVRERFGLDRSACRIEHAEPSPGPGNALVITIESPSVVEVVTSFGAKGISAEKVAEDACDEVGRYLRSGAPVGGHLADQLLLPMALGAGGTFRTMRTTPHTRTNVEVIRRFLECDMTIERESNDVDRVTVGVRAGQKS
jgi:RNA 3'-terminal phosphate cyclase (ATP)